MTEGVVTAPEFDDARCKQYPRFALTAMPDDGDDVTTVTVMPKREQPADRRTHWITIDAAHALPVEECR